MVPVLMGKQNGIKPGDLCPQHLLPEVRPGIDHQYLPVRFYQDGGTKALVPGIIRSAAIAAAGDHRDPL